MRVVNIKKKTGSGYVGKCKQQPRPVKKNELLAALHEKSDHFLLVFFREAKLVEVGEIAAFRLVVGIRIICHVPRHILDAEWATEKLSTRVPVRSACDANIMIRLALAWDVLILFLQTTTSNTEQQYYINRTLTSSSSVSFLQSSQHSFSTLKTLSQMPQR